MSFGFDYIDSPLGIITITASEKGITSLLFGRKVYENMSRSHEIQYYLQLCKKQIEEYFLHQRSLFIIPLDFYGTPFQKKVWTALQNIPYGETISYKELAIVIGNEKACRAVGMANNRNPLPIIIPCHRVIGTSGKLIGYAGELWRKEWLLKYETRMTCMSQSLPNR